MQQLEVRDAIVGAVDTPFRAAFPNVPVIYDNGPFNYNNPPDEYVECEVVFYAGQQVGMSSTPQTRLRGYAYISVHRRAGLGVRASLGVLDWFSASLGYANLGRLQMQAPDPDGNATPPGWHVEKLKIGFTANP